MNQCDYIGKIIKLEKELQSYKDIESNCGYSINEAISNLSGEILRLKDELKAYKDTGIEPFQVKLIQDDNKFLQKQNKEFREVIKDAQKNNRALLNQTKVLSETITKIVDGIHIAVKEMPEVSAT